MDKITINEFNIDELPSFSGDTLICPTDVELSYRKVSYEYSNLLKKADKELVQELADIGFCETGHAVIIQGYKFIFKKIILMPVQDRANHIWHISDNELHQSLRSAFDLARLYQLGKLGLVVSPLLHINNRFTAKLEDLAKTIINEYQNSSITELSVYK